MIQVSTTIRWQWNPCALASHNETRLPRCLYHAAHLGVGALSGLAALVFPATAVAAVLLALLTAFACKCLWFDWHRTSGRLLHLSTFATALDDGTAYTIDLPHWLSDAGLGVLGALAVLDVRSLGTAAVALVVYYGLSTFNGT